METIKLEVQAREVKQSAKALRKSNIIPAVFYGKMEKPLSLQMDYQTFRKAFISGGQSSVIDLHIDGQKTEKALVHDIQLNPLTGKIDHVDFVKVNMKEEITANVPIIFIGVAPAIKDLGGILNTVKDEVEVKCLPTDLPKEIEVDVSGLDEFGAAIHVSDLKLPQGVVVLDNTEDVIVNVVAPRLQEEAEAQTPEAAVEAGADAAEGKKEGAEGKADEGEKEEKGD